MVKAAKVLSHRKHTKLSLDYFYKRHENEDIDKWSDGKYDCNDGVLRLSRTAQNRLLSFLKKALNEKLECTFESFLMKLGRQKKQVLSRLTIAQLFINLGDDVDGSVELESPVGSSTTCSGIIVAKAIRAPKYSKRGMAVDYVQVANDAKWTIFYEVVEKELLTNPVITKEQYKIRMGSATYYLSKWKTLKVLECSREAAFCKG